MTQPSVEALAPVVVPENTGLHSDEAAKTLFALADKWDEYCDLFRPLFPRRSPETVPTTSEGDEC